MHEQARCRPVAGRVEVRGQAIETLYVCRLSGLCSLADLWESLTGALKQAALGAAHVHAQEIVSIGQYSLAERRESEACD